MPSIMANSCLGVEYLSTCFQYFVGCYMLLMFNLFFFQMQVAILTKFIYTAKICQEIRNFSTCIAIVNALKNLFIEQLPVSFLCKRQYKLCPSQTE